MPNPDRRLNPAQPFRSSALMYLEVGWPVFPLPQGKKFPPPTGRTGRKGVDFTREELLREVGRQSAGANIAARMPVGVIGLDIDDYNFKVGGETLAELERQLGALPPTFRLTARGETDQVSGIRFYRIPLGVELAGIAGPNIEVVQRHHRYAVTAPSQHPDTRKPYQWLTAEGAPFHGIPTALTFPALPDSWVGYLSSLKSSFDRRIHSEVRFIVGPDDKAAINGMLAKLPGGIACPTTRTARDAALALLTPGHRHEAILGPVVRLIRLGQRGHPGVRTALAELKTAYVAATADDDGVTKSEREWERALAPALIEIVGTPSAPLPDACSCLFRWLAQAVENRAWFTPGPSGQYERLVMRFLADRARLSSSLVVQESQRQISEGILVGQPEVSEIMRRLRDLGWLDREEPAEGQDWLDPDVHIIDVPRPLW
jgi:hypothetical protein